jgi:hypothetical protein
LLQMFELGRHTNSAFSLPSPQHAAFTSTNPEKEIEKSFTIHCHLTHPIKHGQSDTVHDTDTDTSIPIIIWENDIIKCNHKCRCRTRHMFDTRHG